VLRNPGQSLVFDGMSLDMLRTYNSQGQMSGDNGWLFGFGRQVGGLTGTLNTAGSTVTRTGDDGSTVTYAYDPASGNYVSQGQSGTEDTLHWDATKGGWQWTDGATHNVETYDAAGRLASLTNPQTGASFTFTWQGNQLTQVTAGDGDTLALGYDAAGHLTSLTVSEVPPGGAVAVVRQQATYAYDAAGRLTSVATTLASDTDTAGGTYTTTYTYDGSSDRVASMTQSDGTMVSYVYAQDGEGNYRVSQITTGTGADAQTVNVAYGNGSTTVTDALGNAWTYEFNASGELTAVVSPSVNGTASRTSYTYDVNGNVLRTVDANGGVTLYGYDSHGNLLTVEDPVGNTVSYTYDDHDNMLSRTVYTTPAQGDLGQPGYVPPAGAETTHYVYDANDRIAYVVDATGAVNHNAYATDGNGNTVLASTFAWRGVTYPVGASEPSLADLAAWAASGAVQATLTQGSRVDYTYDIRGQLASQTAYDTVDANGSGVVDAGTVITRAVYDVMGRLLQSTTVRGSNRDEVETVSHAYDGMGRIVSSTDALGHTVSYVYLDNNHTVEIVDASGLITTQVRNSAGTLISSTQSVGTLAHAGETFYDAAGRPIAIVDAQGAVSYTFYDAAGRKVGAVDAQGHAVSYTYDANGHLTATVTYATAVDTTAWFAAGGPTTNMPAVLPPPARSLDDVATLAVFDAAGHSVATIAADGTLTVQVRDANGNVTSSTVYANRLSADQILALGVSPTLSDVQADVVADPADAVTITAYDDQGRLIATIDPNGSVTVNQYDSQGRLASAVEYYQRLSSDQLATLGLAPSPDDVENVVSPSYYDSMAVWVYDESGHLAGTVDLEGNATLYTYVDGRLASTLSQTGVYTEAAQNIAANPTVQTFKNYAGFSPLSKVGTTTIYDASGKVAATVDPDGSVHEYTYDAQGRVTSTSTAFFISGYDSVILQDNPTLEQLNALLQDAYSYGSVISVYDDQGRVAATIDPTGRITLNAFDSAGRLVATSMLNRQLNVDEMAQLGSSPSLQDIQALVTSSGTQGVELHYFDASGNETMSVSSNGLVTVRTYDGAGHLTSQIKYGTAISTYSLSQIYSQGELVPPSQASIASQITASQSDDRTYNFYDSQGNLVAKVTSSMSYQWPYGYTSTPVTTFVRTSADGLSTESFTLVYTMSSSYFLSWAANPTLAGLVTGAGYQSTSVATLKDAQGRTVLTYANYNVVTYQYDTDGNLASTRSYYNSTSLYDTGSFQDLNAILSRVSESPRDDVTRYFSQSDANGATHFVVTSDGTIQSTRTDLQGHIIATATYDAALAGAKLDILAQTPDMATLSTLMDGIASPGAINVYDAAGHTIASLADGVLTVTQRNAAGDEVASTAYSQLPSGSALQALASSGDIHSLDGALTYNPSDRHAVTVRDSAGRPVVAITLDGHVSTWVYDAAGNLIRFVAYATPLDAWTQLSLGTSPTLAQVAAAVTPSAADAMTLNVYDVAGHLVASIGPDGTVTTMRYDAAGRLTETLQGASNLTSHQIAELAYAPTLEGIEFDLNIDRESTGSQNMYDGAGHLTATIDSDGHVTTYSYDGAGNLSTVKVYATPLSSGFGYLPNLTALNAELVPSSGDQISRFVYDAEGRKVASIDTNGVLSITTYAAGGATSTIAFAPPLTAAQLATLGDAPSVAQISRITGGLTSHNYLDAAGRSVATRDAQGRMTYTFYDAMGRVAGVVDGAGTLTSFAYDANGDVVRTTTFAATIDTSTWVNEVDGSLEMPASLPTVAGSAADRVLLTIRDAARNVVATIDAAGTVTTYAYDGVGRTTSTSVRGGALSASQRAALGDSPTLAALNAILPPSASDRTQHTVFDADGRAVATIDAAGYVATATYDALGNVIATRSYATPLTPAQLATIDATTTDTALLALVTPSVDDLSTRSYYDALGRVIGRIDSEGYLTTFAYDETTNTTTSTRHAAALTAAAVNALGEQASVASLLALLATDAGAQQVTDTFDADGELVAHVDATGVHTTYAYDAAGHQTGWSTTDAWGSYGGTATYDAFGRQVSVANGAGEASTSVWDAFGRLSSTTDAAGNTTWYYYDTAGRIAYQVEGRVGPDGVRNARGAVTSFTYDAFGEVASATKHAGLLPLGGAGLDPNAATPNDIAAALALIPVSELVVDETTQFTYDGAGRVLTSTDGDGYVTRYAYDAFGELISQTRTVTAGTTDVTTFAYDARGERIAATEAAGTSLARQTTETFDAFGRVATATDAMGHVTSYTYDRLGRQIGVADVVDGVVRHVGTTYDAFGRVLTQVDALGQVTTFAYDTVGHAMTVTTPEGVTMTTVTDSLGDVVSVADGAGNTTTYRYDSAGRLIQTQDALGDTDTTAYTQGGSVVTTTGAHGDSVVTYDAAGRVLSRTIDPTGADLTTSFSYDGAGRVLTQTTPSGAVTLFEYDGDGNLVRKVDDLGGASVITNYAYDGEGHVVSSTVGGGAATVTTTYTYDSLGRLVSNAVDPDGLDLVTSYVYDTDDNLVETTDPSGISTWYIRDEAGQAVYTFTPTGAVGGSQALVTHVVYDADGHVLASTTTARSVSTATLTALATGSISGNLALGAALFATADDAGARTTSVVRDADGRVRFSIDADGMVTETRYDSLGRISATLRYPVPLDAGSALSADLRAGTATEAELASALSALADDDASAIATYSYYDELGRVRYTAQSVDVDGVREYRVSGTTYTSDGQVATTTVFVQALPLSAVGSNADVASLDASLAAANTGDDIRVTTYVYDHAHRLAATIGPDGATSFIVYDSAGRVGGTVDAAGSVVLYTYDALGRLIAQRASGTPFDGSAWLSNGELTGAYGNLPSDDNDYRTTTTAYDAAGRVSSVSHYLGTYYGDDGGYGSQVVYAYDGAGRLASTADSLFDTNYYSDYGIPFDPQTRTTRYFRDADGNVTGELDPAGTLSVNTYDAAGRLTTSTTFATTVPVDKRQAATLASLLPVASDADQTTRWFRDDRGNTVASIDAGGYLTTYSLDADGRVLGTVRYAQAVPVNDRENLAAAASDVATAGSESTSAVYDAWGRVVSTTNAEGTESRFTYDIDGHVLETTVAYGSDDARTSSSVYDALGEMVSSTDAEGVTTTYTYDVNGRVATTTDGLGNRTWFAYDAAGRVLYTVRGEPYPGGAANRLGEVVGNIYDAFGDLQQTTKYAGPIGIGDSFSGSAAEIASILQSTYSAHDNDQVVNYDHDAFGDVTKVYSSYDNFVSSNYDGFGELISQSAGSYSHQLRSTFTYDADGRLIGRDDVDVSGSGGSSGGDGSMRGPLERVQAWTYDAFGNMASHTDGGGATTTYTYDNLDHQVSDSLTVGGTPRVETESYDAYGRELSRTDALGLTTTFTYDDAQRTIVTQSPGGLTTTSTHNREGQVVAITDAAGQTSRYSYDADGRLLTSSRPDGKSITSVYDAVGNVTMTTDADGHVITYAYDAAGRVVTQTVDPDGLNLVTTYEYSGAGLLLKVTDPQGNITDYLHNVDGTVSAMGKGVADGSATMSYYYYYDGGHATSESGSSTSSDDQMEISRTYDGFGHLTSTDEGLSTIYYSYDSAGNVSTSTQDNVTTYYFYNEANELIYKVTPQSGGYSTPQQDAVTAYTYDADGHLTSTTQFATTLPDSALQDMSSGDYWTPAQVKSSDELPFLLPYVVPSADDRTSYSIYDDQGRVAFEVDAGGTVTETRYDVLGHVDAMIVYPKQVSITGDLVDRLRRGTEDVTAFASVVAAAGNTDGIARETRYIYDALGRPVFTMSEGDVNGVRVGLVTETTYDADGNVLATIEHATTLSPAQVASATLASMQAWAAASPEGRAVRTVYDAAGRATYVVQATGSATHNVYDGAGHVVASTTYAHPLTGLTEWTEASIAAAIAAANPDGADARTTRMAYDSDGNVSEVYAPGSDVPTASYTYDAYHNKASYTNVAGQTWTYSYWDGVLFQQRGPAVDITDTSPYFGVYQDNLQNYVQYEFDGQGRILSASTYGNYYPSEITYVRDAGGNLIRTENSGHSVFDPAQGWLAPDNNWNSQQNTVYNTFNQPTIITDADGNTSYKVYDHAGRLAYDIDAKGYVTAYTYDAYGELIGTTRYAQPVSASTLAGWGGTTAPTLAQAQAAIVASADDRSVTTTYDAFGRKTAVTESPVAYVAADGSSGVSAPTTRYTYDVYGDLTSTSVLVSGAAGQANAVWATSFTFYDQAGRQTMTVDAMGYVSTWAYNGFGEVVGQTDYANPIGTAGLVAGGTPPGVPSASAQDRVTQMAYDTQGRKVSESVLRDYTDAQGQPAHGFVTTSYTYDAEGHVATVTEGGRTITTVYDGMGRVVSVTAPAERVLVANWKDLLAQNPSWDLTTDALYTTASVVMTYGYDAFGNKTVQTQSSTAGGPSESTWYMYDGDNRLAATVTAADGAQPNWTSSSVVHYTYDADGNQLTAVSQMNDLGGDGTPVTVTTTNTYGADGQLVTTSVVRSNGTDADSLTTTTYNAFGEVVATGNGITTKSTSVYDNAGRLISAVDPKTGVVHTYSYDLAGNLVRDTYHATGGAEVYTQYTRDLDGHVLSQLAPSTTSAAGESATAITATYDRWGNVLSSTDANGNTTTYTYNERNQVVTTSEAAVNVVDDSGNATVMAPSKTTSYDVDGNVVAVSDENNNVTQTVYNTAGQVIDVIDAAGSHTRVAYDALGNEVAGETGSSGDGTLHLTFKDVDGQGRVVDEGDYQLSADGASQVATLRQVYVLDEAGNRVIVYDGLGSAALQAGDTATAALHANYYSYDTQGRVIRSQDGAQRAASLDNANNTLPPPYPTPRNFDFDQGSMAWSVSTDTGMDSTTYPGWTFVDGTAVYNGTRAGDGIGSDILNDDQVPVTPGQTINAWADVYSTGKHGGANVFILWFRADGSFISRTDSDNVQTTEEGEGKNTVAATAPPGAAFAKIGVNCTNYSDPDQVNTVYGVGWDYELPAGQLSPGLDGSIFVNLPTGTFSLQPLNPDFENGNSGWEMAPGWQITQTDNTANGKWVSTYTGTSPQTLVNQNRAPVVAGQKITAHARISLDKSDGGEPAGALLILWYDANGNLIRYNNSDTITKGDKGAYQDVTVTDTAPPGAAYATVGLSGNGNGSGAAVFDAVSWDYRYIPTLSPGVIADTYTYDRDGNLVAQRNADGDTESWTRDTYGRITDHTDLSGANYHYTYDASSGLQTGETDNWAGVNLAGSTVPGYVTEQTGTSNTETRTYTAAGLLASISYADGSSYTYSYDANGNQTRQEATTVDGNGRAVHTVTTTTYDSHNRISQVTSDDGGEALTETTTYDAAGNRRSIDATVTAGGVQKSHTTSWYAYDADNRVAVVDGDLVAGAIAISGRSTSYGVTYDTAGNMRMRLTKSGTTTLGQLNQYDNRGELIRADFASALDGSNPRGVAETRTYDAGGNVIVDNQYYASGTTANQRYNPKTDPDSPDYIGHGAGGTTGADIGGYLSTATITRYDAYGRVSAEQTFGHDEYWNGTGGDNTPGPIPDENATTYAGMTLQTSVLYQGPGGSSAYDAMGNVVFYQYRENSTRLDQYTVTYLKKEGYLEAATSGVNVSNLANVRPATDESYYNARGERIAIAQHVQYAYGTVADTVRVFSYDGNGQIITRRDGTASGSTIDQGSTPALKDQHYVYVNGQQVAHYDESTTVDVLSQVTAFSNSNGTGDYVVQEGDTLKSIAQAVYGNASLWYVIAQANALNGDSDLAVGLSLSIPAVTTSKNDSTTFKPYNPSEIQGSTTPNLPVIAPPPPPPKQHCNVIAAIVVIAVVVAASFIVGPLAGAALQSSLAGFAVGAAAGSAAGQLAGDALGTHQGFSFGEVFTAAATAVVTAGVGNYLATGSAFTDAAEATANATAEGTTATISQVGVFGHVLEGAAGYVAQDAAAKLVGQPAHFSWAGLVAGSVASGVASEFGPTQQELRGGSDTTAFEAGTAALAQGVVQRETSVALGDQHVQSWESIGENAAGSYLGSAVGNALDPSAFGRRQAAIDYKVSNGINETIDGLSGDLQGPLGAASSLAGINGDAYGRAYGAQYSTALSDPTAFDQQYAVGAAPGAAASDAPGIMLPASLIDAYGRPFAGYFDPGNGLTTDVKLYDGRSNPSGPFSDSTLAQLSSDFNGVNNAHPFTEIIDDNGPHAQALLQSDAALLPGPVVTAPGGQSWDPSAPTGLDRAWETFTRGAATTSGLGVGLLKSIYKTGYNGVSAASHLAVNGYGYAASAVGSTDPDNAKRAQAFVNGLNTLSKNASNFAEDPYGISGRALTGFGSEVSDAWDRATLSSDPFDRFVGGVDLAEHVGDTGQAVIGAAGLVKAGLTVGTFLADGATSLTLARTTGLTATDLAVGGVMTAADVTTAVLGSAGRLANTGATLVGDAIIGGLKTTSSVIVSGLNAVGDALSGGVAAAGGYVVSAFNGTANALESVVGALRNTSFEAVGDSWHVTTPSGSVYRLQSVVPLGQTNAGIPGNLRSPLVRVSDLGEASPEARLARVTSPNAAMRVNANADGTFVNPLTGGVEEASGRLAADHIVPQDWIRQQPGFDRLTAKQQSAILNDPLNTQGLPTTFNSSKGAQMPGEWQTYKGQPLDPGYVENDARRAAELRIYLTNQIKNFSEK